LSKIVPLQLSLGDISRKRTVYSYGRDEEALAKTITNLLKDEGRLHEMGLEGRRTAEAHDLKQIAKETEELYREVIQDS